MNDRSCAANVIPISLLQWSDRRLPGHIAYRRLQADDHYNRDIAITFPAQLLSFRACFRAEIAQQFSVSQLAKMLIVDHSVTSTFGEVCTALLLHLTSDTGNSQVILFQIEIHQDLPEQETLNGLAILSIEKAYHASPLLCQKGIIRLAGVLCIWLCSVILSVLTFRFCA